MVKSALVIFNMGENFSRLLSPQRKASKIFILIMALACIGCQAETDPVLPISGKVTFTDGSPAQFGVIEFRRNQPTTAIARGTIQKDGTFQVRQSGSRSGLRQGSHKAVIIQVVGTHSGGHIHHHHGQVVADKYRDYRTTDLSVEVSADSENHFEIVVEPKSKTRK